MKDDRCDLCGQLPCFCDDHRGQYNESLEDDLETEQEIEPDEED